MVVVGADFGWSDIGSWQALYDVLEKDEDGNVCQGDVLIQDTGESFGSPFSRASAQGMDILEAAISTLEGKEIPGDVVFKLYDTYGFPADLTADVAREKDLADEYPHALVETMKEPP